MRPEDWLRKRNFFDVEIATRDREQVNINVSDAMKDYTKEMLSLLAKSYNEQKINALKNGGTLKSIDYLILDFMKEHLS